MPLFGGPIARSPSSELRSEATVLARRDSTAAERVQASPTAGDVEQLEMANPLRKRRVDDEVVAERLEPEHSAQEEQRRSRRPRLRAARSRVLDWVLRVGTRVPAERLRQAAVEELSRVEDARGNTRRLLLEPIAAQAPCNEGVVERPDRADVVADRVVARLAHRHRPHAPAGEEALAEQVLRDRLRLR